ncbi:DUF924 family protein [Agrobacterium tumefaciens]|uniref:DUF924 family protein n=1 Tax=Agrobacterium tumefaciens TaxID=358 RepID=UPI0021D2722B|nr:DUF924 family protein [Agrobacterium tumefaciens]UXS02787.1 DUF924 family protein [Agrobacterium tumefaciens]
MRSSKNAAVAGEIVAFWKDAGPDKWFDKDASFDNHFHDRFRDAHFAAARRELDDWLETADSSLALMLLLDQFPRNCFRATAHMYATDPLARVYADEAIQRGHDLVLGEDIRVFFYLPFSHSENLQDQERACRLNQPLGGLYLHHAEQHRDIVKRFGRFPHRNDIMLRETTPQEQDFLDEGGFSG